ncbi:MAG: hypothetical protein M1482_00295 [Chloroflexi bacterium]|nr:hypothetical protein [Chloroflexota bacterium]
MPHDARDGFPAEGSGPPAPRGLTAVEILDQPEPTRGLLSWMLREEQVDLSAIVTFLGGDESQARSLLAALEEKGYVCRVEVDGGVFYRVLLAHQHKGGRGAGWIPTFEDR